MKNEVGVLVISKIFTLAFYLALAIMVAMFSMSSVNVSAAPPQTSDTTLSIGGGNGSATQYFCLTTVGWILAAGAIICQMAFIIIRDIHVLIVDAIL